MKPMSLARGRKPASLKTLSRAGLLAAVMILGGFLGSPLLSAAEPAPAFDGGKSQWHGYDRYDYLMDEATLAITPFTAPAGENFGVKDPEPGKRRCIIVVPKTPAAGNPWSWQGCYWDHQPQGEVELLGRGFHIAYISANSTLKPGKEWDAWFAFLTEQHGLSKKPGFIGMSRGGEYSYTWATGHPDNVSFIYADNPASNREAMMKIGELASRDVPVLHICGSVDPLFVRFAGPIENTFQQWGGRVTTMIKEGAGHHPHSLHDGKIIADWVEQSMKPPAAVPAFIGEKFTRTDYYSDENFYRDYPKEGTYITCRGPGFVPVYSRYQFPIQGVENGVTLIVPATPAPGMPWVFRSDAVERDARVDQALLAKGFHIVTGPVPYNGDGPVLTDWNKVYDFLTAHGFSPKPVLEGRGGAAGDAYAWAIANPAKVSSIYTENPIFKTKMTDAPLLDNLAALAKAGVPVLHVCGSLDPYLKDQTQVAEKRYKELGGKFAVMIQPGLGHFPMSPADPQPVAEMIATSVR
jgi:pimeloyl-ACP methyl ester carboxylesterase